MSNRALREVARQKSLEEVLAEQDVDLMEGAEIASTFFSGIRTYVVNGIAHLLFYSAHLTVRGDVEYLLVARMIAPLPTAKAACGRAAETMRLGRREGPPHPDGVLAN
jgi:hypothetical protein